MLKILVVNLVLCLNIYVVLGAWVEIPQLPNKTPSQFMFGSPKADISHEKFSVTTPSSQKTQITQVVRTTKDCLEEQLMTTTTLPTTVATYLEPQINARIDLSAVTTATPFEDETKTEKENGETNAKSEPPNYSSFLTLLNGIQQTLTHNAKKNLRSKISVLLNLRDTLLANIDERMSNLWQRSGDVRQARGHDDHEMDFPSNEGALMTIGFLTFAVFLIKLVLKLIQALKNKQNSQMMMPMTTSATAAFVGRKKRAFDDYDSLRILQMINDYTFS